MAISSTSSSNSATTTSSLDVASIVSQLMTAENKPIDVIKNKISTQQVFISDIGTIKSDVAALQDALGVFEDVNSYGNLIASTTDSSVVTATASPSASVGIHRVVVTQGAQNTAYNIAGFRTNKDLINLDSNSGFVITVGNTTYSSNGTKTVGGVSTTNAITKIGKTGQDANSRAASTVGDLQNWINGLGLNISATLAQQNSTNWTLRVAGVNQGANNDFSLSGLIGGKSYGGFRTNNANIALDPVTGFKITIGSDAYSTLGTKNGSSTSGAPPSLSSNTTISALAGWVNSLNAGVTAVVTGTLGSYSLDLTPANGVAMSSSGLPGAYATGFSGSNALVSLDGVNGFQVNVGGVAYKTAGTGAIAITGTGAGGGVTVSDLADWINNLSDANLLATVVGSGNNFSLEVSNTNPLTSPVISLGGFNSGSGQSLTTLDGFASAASVLALDTTDGFQLTVDGTTYQTLPIGSTVNGVTVPTLGKTGIGSNATLDDLRAWINDVSSTFGLGLTASISNSGAPYSLSIAGAHAATVAGLHSNAMISGFSNASEVVNLAQGGVTLTVGGHSFNSNGVLGAGTTLTSLNNWINSVASAYVDSSIVGSGNAYDLLIGAKNNTDSVSLSGIASGSIVTAVTVKGYSSNSDPINLDPTDGFELTLGNATYSTKTSSTTLPTSYSGSGRNIASLSDLAQWINNLASDNSLNISASIATAGNGSRQLEITQTNGSALAISISGINPSAYESGFTTSNPNIILDAGYGFKLTIGTTTYSTKDIGNSITASGIGNAVTLNDLKDWINGLQNAQADIIHNGTDYRLFMHSTDGSIVSVATRIVKGITTANSNSNPAQSSIVANATSLAQSGTNTISVTKTATARVITYNSGTSALTLDPTNGFSLTVNGFTYKTSQNDTINGHVIPTLNNVAGSSTVSDLASWVNSLSSTYNLGISAGVTTSGGNSILAITGATGAVNDFSIAGLLAPKLNISGFSSTDSPIAFDGKFTISLARSGAIYATDTTAITGRGPGNSVTLTDLRDWINARSMGIVASITGANSAYTLELLQTGDPSTITVNGLIPDVADMGFPSVDSILNLDPRVGHGFSVTLGATIYSTSSIPITGTGLNNAITATDLRNWINSLRDGGNQVFNASLVGSGTSYSLKVTNFNTGSTDGISVSGVINATAVSDTNVLTATSSTSAVSGVHAVNIKQNAAATVFNIGGFASSSDLVDVNNLNLIVGSNVYYANGDARIGATIGYDHPPTVNTVSGGVSGFVSNLIASSNTHDGRVTIQQLSDWIHNLGDHVESSIQDTENGGKQIHVHGTLTGAANAVGMTYLGGTYIGGSNYASAVAAAPSNGYLDPYSMVGINPTNGFQITIHGTSGTLIYSTNDSAFSGYLNASYTDENLSGAYCLYDIKDWMNAIPNTGLHASIGDRGQLIVTATDLSISSISTSGLNAITTISGFTSYNDSIALDPDRGFQLWVGSDYYSSLNQLPSNSSLGDLLTWINALDPTKFQGSIVHKEAVYSLAIYEINSTGGDYLIASGIGQSINGFGNYGDRIDPGSYNITVGGITYYADQTSYSIYGRFGGPIDVGPMAQSGLDPVEFGGGSYSTLNDLNNWVHALRDAGVAIDSSISGSPYRISNEYSDIHIQGSTFPSDTSNTGDQYWQLFAGRAPRPDDKHAIFIGYDGSAQLTLSDAVTQGNDTYFSFDFGSNNNGELVITGYDQNGNPIKSQTLTIPSTFMAEGDITLTFDQMGDSSGEAIPTINLHTYRASDQYSDASGDPTVTDVATLIADAIPYAITDHQSLIGDPVVITPPTHAGDVSVLDFSRGSTEIDHVRAISNGSQITMIAYYLGGGAISASANVPDVTSNVPFALNFDFGNAGGMKLVINPVISTSDNSEASALIAQGIAYANQLYGTPGWLTYDTGSGLSFNVWGTDLSPTSLTFSTPSATDQINWNASSLTPNPYISLQSSSISLANSSHVGGNIGITSIAQNGGITLQGDGQATTAFILKGTNSDYVLVDDPRNIVYDGNAVFWQGPPSHVDQNYVNDTARGEYLDANTWIGQPGVVLNQSGGQLVDIHTAYTGQLQSNGTVSLNYVHDSPMNNVVIARDAKGTLDGDFFSSASNDISNVNGSGINLSLVQSISPYDPAANANVFINSPVGYSNTPNFSTPASASISRSAAAQDTDAIINGVGYRSNDLSQITVDGIIYSFNGIPTYNFSMRKAATEFDFCLTYSNISVATVIDNRLL